MDTSTSFSGIRNSAQMETGGMNKQVTQELKNMSDGTKRAMQSIEQDITKKFKGITEKIAKDMQSMVTQVITQLSNLNKQFSTQMSSIASTASAKTKTVQVSFTAMALSNVSAVRNMATQINTIMRSLASQMRTHGINAGAGFNAGLASRRGGIIGTARGIASSVTSTIASALRIKSPSRVLMGMGSDTGEGYVIGLQDWVKRVATVARDMAGAMTDQEYAMDTNLVTSASIQGAGVSSSIDGLSDEVRNIERTQPIIEVHNEIVGDKIYTSVKQHEARAEVNAEYFNFA